MDRRQFLAHSLLFATAPLLARAGVTEGPLAERFPRLASALPRCPLMTGPTPVTVAPALGERLGVSGLYVKRDDLAAAVYSGSKVRKLEYFFGHARREGHEHLVTGGSIGSHHALATAVHGSRNGFSVELLLLPEPGSPAVASVLRASAHYAQNIRYIPTARAWDTAWQKAQTSGYPIALGGTSPLGNVGCVEAALELERQVVHGVLPEPARIYVPMGTMGLAVGLLLGLRLTQLKTRLVAVRASNPGTYTLGRFRDLYASTNRWLRSLDPSFPDCPLDESTFNIDNRHLGRGYALPTQEGKRVLSLAREQAGLELELTYTAKALAALAADAQKFGGQPVLFWNTQAASVPDCPLAEDSLPKELWGYLPGGKRMSPHDR